MLGKCKSGSSQVGIIAGRNTSHFFKVLGVLILDDVYGVIDGDDTDDTVFAIHDRHGKHIVPAEHLGDLFLIVVGVNVDGVDIHQGVDNGIGIGQQHFPYRYHPQQLLAGGGDIAGVDGLLIHAVLPYDPKGVLHGKAAAEVDVLVGHQASGGIFGVLKVLIDEFTVGGGGILHHPLYHVGGHFLHQVHVVIHEQIVQDVLQLGIGQRGYNLLLDFRFHVGKDLGGSFLGQQPEQLVEYIGVVFVFQLLKKLGKIDLFHLGDLLLNGRILFFCQKFQNILAHGHTSLSGPRV